ncbi:phosphoribosyltransferase-like protein [Paenibacillus sp. TSA_86.1]|uniref:phosphoribosyltransferase-like protein n=1 Tax=Paenibacillus sp. TSA_86.1 TaxID=3415649 RepID=UPI0040461EEC
MNYELSKIIEDCELKWGIDNNIKDLEEKVSAWINQAETKEQSILLKLLNNFEYYTINRVNSVFVDLHAQFREIYADLLNQYGTNAYSNTLFFPVYKKDGTRTSSYDMHGCYRYSNNLSKHCFKTDLPLILEDKDFPFNEIQNIVFVDDMIGTGDTMIKFLQKLFREHGDKHELLSRRYFLIVIEACSHGVEKIENYINESDINLTLIYSQLHRKAFSENHFFITEELEISRRIIYELELKINANNSRNVLGYGGSEALMSFYHNIPNNTLSAFWQENESIGWKPLFPRLRHDNPFSKGKKLSERRGQQKKSNYIARSL